MHDKTRFHYMDNLRALAMLSGVLFHAALAYSPLMHPFYPAADRAQSGYVDLCIWFLHLFRMPLFFLVAGFFAAMLLHKRGMAGLFRNRLRRIAVPLVIFCPLVIAAMAYCTLHAAASVQHPSPVLVMIQQFSRMTNPPTRPFSTAHLWFLYYLLFFYVLVWAARSLGLDKLGDFIRSLNPAWHLGLLPLLLVPALASVSAPHPAPEGMFPQFWAFGFYGPFFACGCLLFGHEALIQRLRRAAPWLLVASLALYGVYCNLLKRHVPAAANPSATVLIATAEAYVSVWMTCVCLVAGRSLLDHANRVLRYLSDASYWVYITHLPVLFAIQYRLLDIEMGWGAKFAISVVATSALCLFSYHVLVRKTVIGKLLGTRLPVAEATAA
ncbi:acyltransferase family protein [Frateuria sp. GZRR35]|uniref:acyltransferase family protein n=1 Tax=unclassified Frateuria TaxID=2648894 RepID=UPI003EDC78F1